MMSTILAIITTFQVNSAIVDGNVIDRLKQATNEVECVVNNDMKSCVKHCTWIDKNGIDYNDNEAQLCEALIIGE